MTDDSKDESTLLEHTMFTVFSMQEVHANSIEDAIADAGDKLVCVFFWGINCFNCEIAKKPC
jgi:hypothetical protein